MIKVNFGARGVTEFNAADFFLQSVIGVPDVEFSKDSIKLFTNEKNYIELTGDFRSGKPGNPLSYVEQLDGYKIVVDGKMNYQVSGLELGRETLRSLEDLSAYLNESQYRITGNSGNNQLSGADARDFINGGDGRDVIRGNGGNDELIGGKGNDLLFGGAGRDTFVFDKGDGKDQIKDFAASGRNADTIDLSDYARGLKFRDLDISREGKHDVLIEIGRNDEILLQDVRVKDISASDFDF